ncbi:MAG: hypothetical protein M3Q29_15465, partial [Chloroflexota bacterium]|nr:hypothetical protein [Chloroflexota bacterium]
MPDISLDGNGHLDSHVEAVRRTPARSSATNGRITRETPDHPSETATPSWAVPEHIAAHTAHPNLREEGPPVPVTADDCGTYPGPQLRIPSEGDIPDLYKTPPVPVITPTRRLINLWKRRSEQGRTEEQNDELISAALSKLTDKFYVIPVIGPKGGSGKTLLSLICGLILSEHRNARPCLLEANMDWGTLRDLLGDANPRTIAHLLTDLPDVDRAGYGALQGYLTMFGRLPVLTAPTNPDDMQALTPADYDKVVSLLSKHMQVLLLDCGTSFVNRISQYAAQLADHTILVAAPDNPTMR